MLSWAFKVPLDDAIPSTLLQWTIPNCIKANV
jgi:hypothetical protein